MATTTPGFISASNSGLQNLFTTDLDQFNKTVYNSVGASVTVIFPTTDATSTTPPITVYSNGNIKLANAYSYGITVRTDTRNATWAVAPTVQLVANTGVTIGPAVPITSTLTTTVTVPTTPIEFTVRANASPNSTWQYPAQLTNSTITIQVIGGF
jgi:hypothetical protein